MNKLKILLMIVVLSFFNTSSYADENYTIDSLEGFNWSMGLSYDNDKILVADGTNNIILVFDKIKHELLNKILLVENNCNGHIHGIVIYQDTIYSVKSNDSCIVYYNLEGKFLKEFGTFGDEPGEFNQPQNLEIFENKIFVTDSGNNRIQIFDLEGKFLKEFGTFGDKPGEFNQPFDLEIFENKIFVTDSGNNRIQIFDLEGKFLKEFGTFGDKPGEFNGVMGITSNNNKILVADGTNNRIQIFDLEGKFLKEIKSKFNSPHQLLIIENYMYVLDTYNYKVKIFDISIFQESKNENNSFMEIFIILILISLISFLCIFFMRKSKNENSK